MRGDGTREFLFLLNATQHEQQLVAEPGFRAKSLLDGATVHEHLTLEPYGVLALERGA